MPSPADFTLSPGANRKERPVRKKKAKTFPVTCPSCQHVFEVSPMSLFGKSKSRKKALSSKENGRKGGRPPNPNSRRQKMLVEKLKKG